jgi:hypothetical protein
MTIGISNNSAALAILRQSSVQDLSGQQQNATDRIIDIVSGKTGASAATGTISKIAAKAQSLADAEKSASGGGGTVSSEMSRSYSGAVNQAVQSSMDRMYAEGEAVGMKLWEGNLEQGSAVATILINSVLRYNNPPEQREIPTREESDEAVLVGIKEAMARGQDPDQLEQLSARWRSDEGYQDKVKSINMYNESVARIPTSTLIEGFNMLGGQFGYRFGVTPKLSFDDSGQAQVGAFEVKYGNGQTMMSYDGSGNLKTYNADGSEYKSFVESYGE